MNKKVNVLYYHRVYGLKDDINLLCVTPTKFEQQMRYLKRNYDILRFEENWDSSDSGGMVVTFDDGYLDNFQYALPILEELEIPATIFVSVGTLENNGELWWDELEKLILCVENCSGTISIEDEKYGCRWDVSTYELRLNCYYAIYYLMKNFADVKVREGWFEQLREQQNVDRYAREHFRTLDRKSCMELAGSRYITIGAHTVSHPSLAKMSTKDQQIEVLSSKDYLEKLLKKEIDMFSYPFGMRETDYNKETVEICKQSGIRKAASTVPGIWTAKCSNYEIPRNIVRNWGISEFQYMIDNYWKTGVRE